MNPKDDLDDEIEMLEEKLGMKDKRSKKQLVKELKEENLFELFSCVDRILKGDFKKGGAPTKSKSPRELKPKILRETEQEEGQAEEFDEEHGEEEDSLGGEEEFGEEELGEGSDGQEEDFGGEGEEEFSEAGAEEEGLSEEEEADPREQEAEAEVKHAEPSPDSRLHKPQATPQLSQLVKRPPEAAEPQASLQPEPKESSNPAPELVALLAKRIKDNKDLVERINELTGLTRQLKLTGGSIYDSLHEALRLKKPLPADKPSTKQAAPRNQKPAQKELSKPPAKEAAPASKADRIKHCLYVLSLFPRPTVESFVKRMLARFESSGGCQAYASAGYPTSTLWVSSGLYFLGLVTAGLLAEVARRYFELHPPDSAQLEADTAAQMDKEVHVVLRPIRRKDPGAFKAACEVFQAAYCHCPQTAKRLAQHIEKLRNNMDIPGETPFEVSNSAIKLLEKLQKKKKVETARPLDCYQALASVAKPPSSPGPQAGGPKERQGSAGDVLRDAPLLKKLADKLDLVTQLERKVLRIVNESTDYIDVVQGLVGLKTHGSENKEVAYPILKCCLNEKAFNRFYLAVAQKLISLKPEFSYSFQLCLWDEIKALDQGSEAHVLVALAKFSCGLMTAGALDHRYLKFLDQNPLPLPVAKFTNSLLTGYLKAQSKEQLIEFAKKLKKKNISIDTCNNLRRILRYALKKHAADSEEHEKVVKFLRNMPQDEFDFENMEEEAEK